MISIRVRSSPVKIIPCQARYPANDFESILCLEAVEEWVNIFTYVVSKTTDWFNEPLDLVQEPNINKTDEAHEAEGTRM